MNNKKIGEQAQNTTMLTTNSTSRKAWGSH